MNSLFNIQGNSGCKLDVKKANGKLHVIKSCNESYAPRLRKQYIKQVNDNAISGCIRVPDATWDYDTQSMIMDYIHADSYASFMEKASLSDLDSFVSSLSEYIRNEVSKCRMEHPDNGVFINKMDSVIDNMRAKRNFDDVSLYKSHVKAIAMLEQAMHVLKSILSYIPVETLLPVGQCHGDLTMSNILFTNDAYYLIDYLDSYIETPVQDIVKIRQDTRLHWSQLMTNENIKYNWAHINIAMNFVDRKIQESLQDVLSASAPYYTVLEIVNLARIFPYAKNKHILDWLTSTMSKLIDL